MSETSSLSGEIVLLVFIGLLLAISAYEIKKWLGIPVAPCLMIFGILLRIVGEYIPHLNDSVQLLDTLDPHMVLFVIMPSLIFEASLGTDWYTFKQELWQIVPMATTVVIGSTVLTAVVIKYLFSYDFSWAEAILIGVILSATDHVAVVAQLKEVFASKRLETLISGETLLNEATVIVIFVVIIRFIEGEVETASSFLLFFRLAFGGFALGMVFAFALGFVLGRMVNDDFQEITITIASAYLLFYVADGTEVHVSGALALVTLGLYMSAYGKTLVSPNCEHLLHGFWKIVGTNVESIVFILGGMLLGMHFIHLGEITPTDIGYMFALFGLLYVIRGLVVLIHFPLLRCLGYGLNAKEALVIVLAGSKGAIATALALIASHAHSLDSYFKSILLFYTVAIAALTIIFGSIIVKVSVHLLGLESLTETQERMLISVTTAILNASNEKIDEMKTDRQFKLANWEKVRSLAGGDVLMKQVLKSTKRGSELIKNNPTESVETILNKYQVMPDTNEDSLIFETRHRFFATLKGIYWHEFVNGQCLGDSVLILMNSANRSIDQEMAEMNDWAMIEAEIHNPTLISMYVSLSKIPLIGRWFRNMLYEHMTLAYDCCNTFIKAHHEAEVLIDEMEIDLDAEVFKRVMEEAKKNVKSCQEFISHEISDGFPEIMSEVQSKIASHSVLLKQRNLLLEIYEQGVIEELEFEYLVHTIDKSIKRVTFQGKPHLPESAEILRNKFPKASAAQINELSASSMARQYGTEERLFEEGGENQGAYLITNGKVREFSKWVDQELRIGNIVGVQHILPQYRNEANKSTAQALGLVMATRLPNELINDRAFNRDLYLEAAEEIILLNKEKLQLESVNEMAIYSVVKGSKIVEVEEGDTLSLKSGGFLFEGKVDGNEAIQYIKPKSDSLTADSYSILLVFPDELGNAIKQLDDLPKAFQSYMIKEKMKNVGGGRSNAGIGFGLKMMSSPGALKTKKE